MSIRDLFDPQGASKIVSAKSLDDLASDAESADNVVVDRRNADRFLPPIDFKTASNFAVYGSAEKYYSDAVTRIYQEFPYDGSQKEMTQFELSSSYLDRYILEEKYPRTNGFIIFSAESAAAGGETYGKPTVEEYIVVKGGPNTTLSAADDLTTAFAATPERDQNNVLDLGKGRGNNLAFNPASGSTVEFWLKKSEFPNSRETVFDLWNQAAAGSADYGRLRIDLDSSSGFIITYRSGSAGGFANNSIGSAAAISKLTDDAWHHYALVFASSSAAQYANLYVDGELDATVTPGTARLMSEVRGALVGYIGALQTTTVTPSIGSTTTGDAKLSASLDEFRYWKTARSPEEIGRNWFTQVRGGTNTDDANTDLGVYFKFNEGITTVASLDSTVLDYSGRISNGAWTGYNTNARSTGSAMVQAGAATSEFKDPIIYSEHPEVGSLKIDLEKSGSVYDYSNNASIYHSLPAWITEEDSSGDLKNLTQIVGSYFDKLQNQVRYIPELRNIAYLSASQKPYPFASELVDSAGLTAPEIFVDAGILQSIMDRDEDRDFALQLDDVKNQIYQNIYNNLVYINKSKGTEKSFRNLIHCYGIDEKLVRLNTYGNNLTYELRDNFRSIATAKNTVNFDKSDNHNAVIYQMTSSTNSNSVSFISGTVNDGNEEDYIGFTLESEMVFPKFATPAESTGIVVPSFQTSSLFGMHSANTSDVGDTTWATNDYADLRVLAIKPKAGSKDTEFHLISSVGAIPTLTSSVFKDVYNDNKWNFGVRIINEKHPIGNFVIGASTSGSSLAATPYRLEFFGVNSDAGIIREEFYLTGTIANAGAVNALRSAKRVFAGAHRTNFTGTVLQRSDVRMSSVRYWADYVSNEVIKAHARDVENYGRLQPNRNAFLTQNSLTGTYVPEAATLALNWNFYNLTSSDASGQFIVDDYSSGSSELQGRYGWYGNIVKAQHTGRGEFFATSSDDAVEKYYFNNSRQSAPEVIQTSEMINIMTDDSTFYDRGQRPIDYYFSIEKSMYQVISDEMINFFATIAQFNNLIGDPINRYRQNYKSMEKLRQLFFESVENTPDLDRFIDFYKWIDSSISIFLQQLIPASANSSDSVRTLIESHILERNKYWSKFPTLDTLDLRDLESAALGSGAGVGSPPHALGLSNPVFSSRPISGLQRDHGTYWRLRAPRTSGILSSGDANVDRDREQIRVVVESAAARRRDTPVNLSTDNLRKSRLLHGGTNYDALKNRSLIFNAVYPQGPKAYSGTPLNVVLTNNTDVQDFVDVDDVIDPNKKKYFPFEMSIRRVDETGQPGVNVNSYESVMAGTILSPFNLLSSSTPTNDYNDILINQFKTGSHIVNLHSDTTTFDNEIPMQGPFTRTHVGGHQSRHVDLNRYSATKTTINNIDGYENRPEAWQILIGPSFGTSTTFLGFAGADYPYPVGPYPMQTRKLATRYREEFAKRPVNIRNIKYGTSSINLGNYQRDYEIIQTSGRGVNNKFFVDNEGIALPELYSGATTNTNAYFNLKAVFCPSSSSGLSAVSPAACGYEIGNHSSLNTPTSYSFSCWISSSNASAVTTNRYLFAIGAQNDDKHRGMYIEASTNKLVLTAQFDSADPVWKSNSAIDLSLGYHHIAASIATATDTFTPVVYVDNAVVAGALTANALGTLETPTEQSSLLCGRKAGGGIATSTQFYSGSAAEMSYWNTNLNASQVGEIYSQGGANQLPGPQDLANHSAYSNLVSWWRMGDGPGDGPRDQSQAAGGTIVDQKGSNDADAIAGVSGMTIEDISALDLEVVGGGSIVTTTLGYLPETTNVNSLIGINPQTTNAGNYFGHIQTSPSTLSNRYSGSTNYSVRGRSSNDYIIAERFSAPGGPEVNSLGFLDIASEEKSVYNALPFRNLSIRSSGSGESATIRVQDQLNKRRGLRTLLALHAGQFGSDSMFGTVPELTYVTTPSYQKNNRNTLKRLKFVGEMGLSDASGPANYQTSSVFDNAHIVHSIPRTDLQYSWITSSYSLSKIYGHAWNDSVYSSSLGGFEQSIQFITEGQTSADGISVDFANLNTLIHDPLDINNNILSSSTGEYRNTEIASLTIPEMLNGLLLHRNGPYGVNTWKQLRADSSRIVRELRKRNIVSYFEKSGYSYPVTPGQGGAAINIQPMYGPLTSYTEAPLTTKYKPLTQRLTVRQLNPDSTITEGPVSLRTSYGNSLAAFNNPGLNNSYNVRQDSPVAYTRIKDLYLENQDADPNSPVESFESLTYRETVYPGVINTYSSSIRVRDNYANSFWRTTREDRALTGQQDLLNLVDIVASEDGISESMWSLDANVDFLTFDQGNAHTDAGGAGVLQNLYCQFHSGNVNNITASVQYARRHTIDMVGAVVGPVGALDMPATGTNDALSGVPKYSPFSEPGGASDAGNGISQYYSGQALWEAGAQSSGQPWYNNYDDYVKNMRLAGKEYSIVPSFRISENIARYTKELNGDYLADNPTFLEMTGTTGDKDKSDDAAFYTTYTNSDFLKFFEVVRDEHVDVAAPTHITLKCSALKKFIPYNGFYPAERMVDLGQQFSSSYGGHVNFTGTDADVVNARMRAFMAPFYAPGIGFNTIKSGLAVDYPMFSASMDTHTTNYKKGFTYAGAVISGSNGAGQFHYRIPFEAMVEPEKYISDKDIIDLEPHPSCSIDVTASWGGGGNDLYKMMANNFWAEVPDFFLPEQQFTSLVSRPESTFLQVSNGEQFAARIKVYKSLNAPTVRTGSLGYRNPIIPRLATPVAGNIGGADVANTTLFETFTMYSRPTAFGPPAGGGGDVQDAGAAPGTPGNQSIGGYLMTGYDGYNLPFTPPYYNGECWADLIFTAPRASTSDKPITLQEIFSPDNLSVTYKRVGDEWNPDLFVNTIYHSASVETNAMQMDASFNLFGRAQIKNLRYDPATGQPIEALDSNENVWIIQPKMETPMLNFSGAAATLPTNGSASVAIGMWHQYGVLPDDPSEGIFLQVADLPDNYIKYALGGNPATTGSLADLVGFKTSPVRLGAVAPSKTVSEAVVAIPYVLEEGQKNFFSLSRQVVDNAETIVQFGDSSIDDMNGNIPGESVISMVRAMKKYVLPPRFDFIENPEAVDPFSMYIFEFEHTFDQQDLVDMWQNLLPKIGYSFDTSNPNPPPSSQVQSAVTIEHDLLINEILDKSLNSKVQWMLFKVKQKANKNYFSKVTADELNQVSRFNRDVGVEVGRSDSGKTFQPKYSYNWPYDFFSLVELVKLDAEITLSKEEDS